MEELFTAKSDSPIQEIRKKKNNAQIISTLRSETEFEVEKEIKETKEEHKKKHQDIKNKNMQNNALLKKNDNIQNDIVNIAETIHNLANMMNLQIEKISSLEKEVSKIKTLETKFDELIIENKTKVIKPVIMSDSSDSVSVSMPVSALKKELPKELNKNFALQKNKVQVQDTCNSETCNDYQTTKNVEYKLNSVVKGFNSQLINLKRKQALIASSYVIKKRK